MRRKTTVAAILALVMLLVTSISAFAQAPQREQTRRNGMQRLKSPLGQYYVLKKMKDQLKLTDAQLAEIKKISFNLAETLLALRSENQKIDLESRKLLDADTPDYATVEQNVTKRAINQGKIFVDRLKARKAIESILTAEQKQTMAQARKRWAKKAWERRDHWRMRQLQGSPKTMLSR
ncbi:MAG: Spy/CpxP family protein refolding chaperone [Deltaproteobacteria bacterium]|nr:Spy/CpxP family protein refolding chaperone [Deltaproteobacteria bacterium]